MYISCIGVYIRCIYVYIRFIWVFSNLIVSLSRTIQQYSPPSDQIMCELSVFPIFLENDLLKVNKILGLTSFKARFKAAFLH